MRGGFWRIDSYKVRWQCKDPSYISYFGAFFCISAKYFAECKDPHPKPWLGVVRISKALSNLCDSLLSTTPLIRELCSSSDLLYCLGTPRTDWQLLTIIWSWSKIFLVCLCSSGGLLQYKCNAGAADVHNARNCLSKIRAKADRAFAPRYPEQSELLTLRI